MCLWVVRGWKVGELERIAREEEATAAVATNTSALTERQDVGDEKKDKDRDDGAIGQGRRESEPEQLQRLQLVESKVWSPASLVRRMVAWKRV